MPNTHAAIARAASQNQIMFPTPPNSNSTRSGGPSSAPTPLAGETLTITCFTCGMPSSTEWAQHVIVRPCPTDPTKPYFPCFSQLTPPIGSVLNDDGSTFVCAFCHASFEAQWNNYQKSETPIPPKARQYNSHNFTCAVCCVTTYRKRVRALPFQEFPFLVTDRQPGSITLGENPLAVVCLDCSETLWAQSAEYDRWGLPIQKRHFNWMARPPPPEDSMEATVARLPSGETQLPRTPIILSRTNLVPGNAKEVLRSAAGQTARAKQPPKSSKAEPGSGRRDSRPDLTLQLSRKQPTSSTPIVIVASTVESIAIPSQPPVVTVAPMASHRNSSSVATARKGSTSIPPNLSSSSSSSILKSAGQSYSQSQAPPPPPLSAAVPGTPTLRHSGAPIYPTPTYTPYAWTRREIEEHFPYSPSVESAATRTNSVWNWLTPQESPDHLLRYQSYLASFENRNPSITDTIFSPAHAHALHSYSRSGAGALVGGAQPLPTSHPPHLLPPHFLPVDYGHGSIRNSSPPHTNRAHTPKNSPPYQPQSQSNFEDDLHTNANGNGNGVSKIKSVYIGNSNSNNGPRNGGAIVGGTAAAARVIGSPRTSPDSVKLYNNTPAHHQQKISQRNGVLVVDSSKAVAISSSRAKDKESSESDKFGARSSAEREFAKTKEQSPIRNFNNVVPIVNNNNNNNAAEKNHQKLLPKKRKYHFEPDQEGARAAMDEVEVDSCTEPMDYSLPTDGRHRMDSSSISASEAETFPSGASMAALPVDLTVVPQNSGAKSDIPPNFMIAYLCNQMSKSKSPSPGKESPPQTQSGAGRNSRRGSVIVSALGGGEDNTKNQNQSRYEGGKEFGILERVQGQIQTPVYDEEVLVFKSRRLDEEAKKSVEIGDEAEAESAAPSDERLESLVDKSNNKEQEQDRGQGHGQVFSPEHHEHRNAVSDSESSRRRPNVPNSPKRDLTGNDIPEFPMKLNGKSEAEIEAFVQETLEVFKQKERIRTMLKEKEVRRKINFLRRLDLVTLQDKSDIELRKFISRFDHNTLPPLKFRPATPPTKPELGDEFEKQIVVAALAPIPKPTASDIDQLHFMSNLKLKPASRAEKFRREQEWRLFLLETKMREARKFKARGVRRLWDNVVTLPKLLSDARRNSSALGKLSLAVAPTPPKEFHFGSHGSETDSSGTSCTETTIEYEHERNNVKKNLEQVQEQGQWTKSRTVKPNRVKPIINYPKYVPNYSTSTAAAAAAEIGMELKSTNGEFTDEKQHADTDKLVMNESPATTTTFAEIDSHGLEKFHRRNSQGNSSSLRPICIPNVPAFNSVVGRQRLSADGDGDRDRDIVTDTDTCVVDSAKMNWKLGQEVGKSEPEPEVVSGLAAATGEVLQEIHEDQDQGEPQMNGRNGFSNHLQKVGSIIQGYSECWTKTKREIEEILASAKTLKPENKNRRQALNEIKRLRKSLVKHQAEIKILEKKLRKGEKDIQVGLLGGGQNTHANNNNNNNNVGLA